MQHLSRFVRPVVNFVKDESGPTAVDYAVMLALIIVEDEGSMIGFAAAVLRCVLTQIFVASGQRHLSPPTEKHGASQLSIPGHCHEATAQSCGCVVTASDADH